MDYNRTGGVIRPSKKLNSPRVILIKMSTQGKAARSATGAAMSKYDVEVEARLKALESANHSHEGGGDNTRVEQLVAALKREFPSKFADL